jgi:hypothetical protein
VSRVPSRFWLRARVLLALLGCAGTLVGCGAPPGLQTRPGSPPPAPSSPPPTSEPPIQVIPPAEPTPTGSPAPTFAEGYATDCNGYPSGAEVIRVLRRTSGLLPAGLTVTVQTGPLCAGTWQYTILAAPNREPLGVVTKGRPGALRLVTAGTDVCNIPVRTEAPAGIRAAAGCP